MESAGPSSFDTFLAQAREAKGYGQTDAARRLYSEALQLQPDNYQALTQLALLEYRAHAFTVARELLRRALAAHPDDPDILVSLAATCQAGGHPAEAITCLESLVRLRPDQLQTYLQLAASHQGMGRLEAARDVLVQAKTRGLFDASAHCLQARVLEQIAETSGSSFEDAIQAYRTSIALAPAHAEPAGRLALLLEKIERIDEAEHTAREGLVRAPGDPVLRLALAKCRYRQRRYAEGIECLQGVNIQACPPQLQILIGSELGALHDKAGLYDRAYEYFSISNQAAKSLWDSHSGETESYIQRMERLLRQAEQLQKPASSTPIEDGHADPVFLIGFPRSGTTLLDQILDSHPNIHTLEEIPIFDLLLSRSGGLNGRYPLALDMLSASEIAELRAAYLAEVERHIPYQPDKIFVDKLPLNIGSLPLIKRMFPQARFILAIRHPCDACLSCFMQSFRFTTAMASFYSLPSAVRLYDLVMRLWVRFEAFLEPDYHMIRYEDVVEDLEGETRRLLDFLGLEWDENMRHFDRHARNRLSINTPSYRQVRQPIYRSSVYRWKHYLRHFEPLLPVLRPHMERFGYGE